MAKFRKKPIIIQAIQVRAVDCNLPIEQIFDKPPFSECPDWLKQAIEAGTVVPDNRGTHWNITTPQGILNAHIDDWIIRGVKGELYPCSNDVFTTTYERVE